MDGTTYLHLRAPVLEPELNLAGLEAELAAEIGALRLVGVGALLEHPANTRTTDAITPLYRSTAARIKITNKARIKAGGA